MRNLAITAACLTAFALPATAEQIVPANVAYMDGAVSTSLTGMPGNPAEGRKIMNKGAGNCIACHAVSDLAELPFHGEVGPELDGVPDRWGEAELRVYLANAKEMFPEYVIP